MKSYEHQFNRRYHPASIVQLLLPNVYFISGSLSARQRARLILSARFSWFEINWFLSDLFLFPFLFSFLFPFLFPFSLFLCLFLSFSFSLTYRSSFACCGIFTHWGASLHFSLHANDPQNKRELNLPRRRNRFQHGRIAVTSSDSLRK